MGGLCRTNAREELRLQAGTLRFDLNTLIAQKEKSSRKAAEALKKDFLLKASTITPIFIQIDM